MVATDGFFTGMDALRDEQKRWSVSLHDANLGRTIQIGNFELFEKYSPYFLQKPRPQPLHFWGHDEAQLRLSHVLAILKHVEQAYPQWKTYGLFENCHGRYEVTLMESKRSSGVYSVTTLDDFQRIFSA
jgi:hypothetical protein